VPLLIELHRRLFLFMGKVLLVMLLIKTCSGVITPEAHVAKHPRAAGRVIEVPARQLSTSMKLVIGPSRININEVHIERKEVRIKYKWSGTFAEKKFRPTERVKVIRSRA
jgi:hypothetical protein